jgi:hypothetical protein
MLAYLQACLVTIVPHDPGMHQQVRVIDRHMGRDLVLSTVLDGGGVAVVARARADCGLVIHVCPSFEHSKRRLAFCSGAGLGSLDVHDEPIAILLRNRSTWHEQDLSPGSS